MTDPFTAKTLFSILDQDRFDSYSAFEDAVRNVYNDHLRDFPAHYSYRDAISLARRNKWLRIEGGALIVSVEHVTNSA